MHRNSTCKILTLFSILLLGESVKIGISKPVSPNNNTEANEISTPDPSLSTLPIKPNVTSSTIHTTTTTTIASTAITQTEALSTTTAAPPSVTGIVNNKSQPSRIKNENVYNFAHFCDCDLSHQHCDIDCCCDIDCSSNERNSFNCDREKTSLEDFHYHQGLPPCKINEGWLCVFRNNADNTKKTQPNLALDIPIHHEWPSLLLENIDILKERDFYKIGDPILLYDLEGGAIVKYDLPFSVTGQHCQIVEPILHLISQNITCRISIERAQNLESMLFQKMCTSFLIQRYNAQISGEDIISKFNSDMVPINLFRCGNDFGCLPISVNNSIYDSINETDYSSVIQTKIYHNITHLIACDVLFYQSSQNSEKVWQTYEVVFLHSNKSDVVRYASGPLGYIIGSPLITGRKVLFNETAAHIESNLILSYFLPNQTEPFYIHPPQRRQGHCVNSSFTVNFGESILVECLVQLNSTMELGSESNFTHVCANLQSRSLKFLQLGAILEEDYLISMLGYPVNKSVHWAKIEVRNYEHLPVVGKYLDREFAFVCENMILGVKYEFFTNNEIVGGVSRQNVLKRATIDVGRRHDLQFQLDETISMPIAFSVVFQDLNEISRANTETSCFNIIIVSFSFSFIIRYEFL